MGIWLGAMKILLPVMERLKAESRSEEEGEQERGGRGSVRQMRASRVCEAVSRAF